jgi:Domain of unknown function (DUF1844)
VSTLWTPSGEHRPEEPEPDPGEGPGPEFEGGGFDYDPSSGDEPSPEQIAEMLRSRAELASVPVTDIIANHAVGLWQLAVLHLMPDPDPEGLPAPPRLDEARLAIDALGALVEGLGPRLAPHDETLRDALSQLRLAYVQVADGGVTDTPGG